MDGLQHLAGQRLWSTLWLVQWTNIALLAASLIPAHPFAGGRIVESALEPWLGREGALRSTLVVGMVAGIALVVAGLAFGALLPALSGATAVAVAMSGGRLMGLRPGMAGLGIWTMIASDASAAARARAQVRAERQARDDDAALDGILAKVATHGIDSLTKDERQALARTTARRREGHEGGKADESAHGDRPGHAGADGGESAAP